MLALSPRSGDQGETHPAIASGAAACVVDVANATMGQAMRLVTVQRGLDPRAFCMVAFGGATPAHANALAAALGISVVLIPPGPGVAAALGMLVSDLRHDYRATHLQPLAAAHAADLGAIFQDFAASADATLAGRVFRRSASDSSATSTCGTSANLGSLASRWVRRILPTMPR